MKSRRARRESLRAAPLQRRVYSWALAAGLAGTMLGALAYLTKSILPGVVVHAAGLFTFFGVIWPRDKGRLPLWQSAADFRFWIHLIQTVLFAALSLFALRRLARLAKPGLDAKPA